MYLLDLTGLRTPGSLIAGLLLLATLPARAAEPFADVHIHFNWDQKELIEASEIVARLRRAEVDFAVVSGTPSRLALELARSGGDRLIPFFSPYTHELGKRDWYRNPSVLQKAEAGLRSGDYRGIGEVHLMRGFPPRADNPVFQGLILLALQYEVPLMLHIDASNETAIVEICRQHPGLKLQFAHAGGNLKAAHIRRLLESCEQVMVEFSARDPWRYGALTDADGYLLADWRALVIDYPERFMTGTDPVWKVTRTQTWDQPDEGWDHFERLMDYHRRWIGALPPDVASKIRLDNARRFFGVDGQETGKY